MKLANDDDNNRKNNDVKQFTTSFSAIEKQAVYKAILSRRDVRSRFKAKNVPNDVLRRILDAAHHAPSVGFSQPWNFIVIKNKSIREQVKNSFLREHRKSVLMLDDTLIGQERHTDSTQAMQRKEKYLSLKLEGIIESAVNICVTYDSTRFGPFVLGRTSIPETGIYSVCCAIQNLWLAARAEGLGVGWVSIISNEDLKRILDIPAHVKAIAYLSLGYVDEFADKPDLEKAGWLPRLDLDNVLCYEQWGCGINKENIFS